MRISDTLAEVLLKRSGKIDKEQLADLRSGSLSSRKPLQDLIIQNGILSEEELTRLYADELQLPYIELPVGSIDHGVLTRLPEHVATRYNAVVFDISDGDNEFMVAMEDPSNFEALSFLQKQLGENLKLHVVTSSHIKDVLDQYRSQRGVELFTAMPHLTASTNHQPMGKITFSNESAATQSINSIIQRSISDGASDVHIEPRLDHVVIRYRIDGLLHETHKLPITALRPLTRYIKTSAHLKLDEQRTPQYGQWTIALGEQHYIVRASVLPTIDGEKIVLHIIHESPRAPSLRDLGLWGEGLTHLQKAITEPHGTVFISGPTGSGKSTTLFSILNALNSPNVNIATIEDPVEYRINGANQVQIDHSSGITLASGLRAILKQDPNIIMISEVHDSESTRLAVQASLSGHLVFSTLHTASAAGGIRRLLDMDIEPHIIASNLRAIVGQRLARRLCTECREIVEPDSKTLKQLEKSLHLSDIGGLRRLHELEAQALEEGVGLTSYGKPLPDSKSLSTKARSITRLWKALEGGCEHCHHTGYLGRVGIFEVLTLSDTVQKAVLHSGSEKVINQAALESGMISMQLDGLVKALRGQTTIDEVLRVRAHGI